MFQVSDAQGTILRMIAANEMSFVQGEVVFESVTHANGLTSRSFVESVPMFKGMSILPIN